MRTNAIEVPAAKPVEIPSFKVRQAMIGMKMDEMDVPLLRYFDFLACTIPVGAGYFLHVSPRFELSRSFFEKADSAVPTEAELQANRIKLLKSKIKTQLSNAPKMGIECEVKKGDRLEGIIKDAEKVYADLLVLGKKEIGHTVFIKNLVRKIKCSTLVVPEKAKHQLKKILVPIDFSTHSIKALHTAIGIAKQLVEPAQVICLNVFEMPSFASFNITKTREQFYRMVAEDRLEAFDAFLDNHAPEEKDRLQKILLQKEMPWVPQYILEYANGNEIDFIVMGAKGHSKVELLFIGSVTEKLLMINNSIPTLVVKK